MLVRIQMQDFGAFGYETNMASLAASITEAKNKKENYHKSFEKGNPFCI